MHCLYILCLNFMNHYDNVVIPRFSLKSFFNCMKTKAVKKLMLYIYIYIFVVLVINAGMEDDGVMTSWLPLKLTPILHMYDSGDNLYILYPNLITSQKYIKIIPICGEE